MAKQLNDFPTEIKDQLTEGAQNTFVAAFNSAQDNGMSEDGALQVAWNSVKQWYEQGSDGKWHRKPQDSAEHYKAITTGGN